MSILGQCKGHYVCVRIRGYGFALRYGHRTQLVEVKLACASITYLLLWRRVNAGSPKPE